MASFFISFTCGGGSSTALFLAASYFASTSRFWYFAKLNLSISCNFPSGVSMCQYDWILDSAFSALDDDSFSSPAVIVLEFSASGWPLTWSLYDFVQPNGARYTSRPGAFFSIACNNNNAVVGDASFELRWA